MKILHLSTFDVTGGAARSAYRIHSGLRRLGYDSQMFVAGRKSHDPTVTVFARSKRVLPRLERALRRRRIKRPMARYPALRSNSYEIFTDNRTIYGSDVVTQLPACGVIHLHWIANFIDYSSFFGAVNKPMVWTLHDMNPFTGGCHYDNGCGKWRNGCGGCPQLASDKHNDLSRQIWRRKEKIFKQIEKDQLHIVVPSEWMAREVKHSPILGQFPVTIIPYGLDLDCFASRDRTVSRNVLGVPLEARVMLLLGDSLKNKRKGFGLLSEILIGLKDVPRLVVISVGGDHLPLEVNVPHVHLGFIESERILSLVYSAADVFVVPSLQDNLPNTVLESLACGTPVVGFDVGGIPELVRPEVTGTLVPRGDIKALCGAIKNLFENPSMRVAMSANCRNIAQEYSLESCARRYVELYTRVAQ
ncbi:MAG TPA: glycosyltransferase family 4 protein [Nitrososphaera sp.]|nr:glycosyltransferase family 4 protein [Nitrososphaera sp.]